MGDKYISREEVLNLIDTAFECGAFDGRYAYENLIDAVQNLIHPLETDLISRQAVKSVLYNLGLGDEENGEVEYKCALADVKSELENIPSVEPERKQGKWFLLDECANEGWYCDQCHKKVFKADFSNTMRKYKFCPNCGAEMCGEEGEKSN